MQHTKSLDVIKTDVKKHVGCLSRVSTKNARKTVSYAQVCFVVLPRIEVLPRVVGRLVGRLVGGPGPVPQDAESGGGRGGEVGGCWEMCARLRGRVFFQYVCIYI